MEPTVKVRYLDSKYKGQADIRYTQETRHKLTSPYDVVVHDGRSLPNNGRDQLARHGFVSVPFASEVQMDLGHVQNPSVYRNDPGIVEGPLAKATRETYFREAEALVGRIVGAAHCFAISHAVRKGNDDASGKQYLTAYATFAHCDYTAAIAPNAWKMLAKRGVPVGEAQAMDVAFINLWQPTNAPVEQFPLAVLDWESVNAEEDVTPVQLGFAVTPTRGGKEDTPTERKQQYAPQIAQLTHRDSHRWFTYPQLAPSEALLFTQYDSRESHPTHCFHTAFIDPKSPPNAVPRHNIEVRLLCAWPKPVPARKGEGAGEGEAGGCCGGGGGAHKQGESAKL